MLSSKRRKTAPSSSQRTQERFRIVSEPAADFNPSATSETASLSPRKVRSVVTTALPPLPGVSSVPLFERLSTLRQGEVDAVLDICPVDPEVLARQSAINNKVRVTPSPMFSS